MGAYAIDFCRPDLRPICVLVEAEGAGDKEEIDSQKVDGVDPACSFRAFNSFFGLAFRPCFADRPRPSFSSSHLRPISALRPSVFTLCGLACYRAVPRSKA